MEKVKKAHTDPVDLSIKTCLSAMALGIIVMFLALMGGPDFVIYTAEQSDIAFVLGLLTAVAASLILFGILIGSTKKEREVKA